MKEPEIDGKKEHRIIDATVGRLIINDAIPQNLGFQAEIVDDLFPLERSIVGKKYLGKIIDKCIRINGFTQSTEILDKVKALGYSYSTRASITVPSPIWRSRRRNTSLSTRRRRKSSRSTASSSALHHQRRTLPSDRQQWEKSIKDVTDALQSNLAASTLML